MAVVDILIPTYERPEALAVTLTSISGQSFCDFRVIISDQGETRFAGDSLEVQPVVRLLRSRGHEVDIVRHIPRRGVAENRQFLLEQASATYCLFLDDDVLLTPDILGRLVNAIEEQRCGFVGSALVGLSYIGQRRPEEEHIEYWEGPVQPEVVEPDSAEWERYKLHNAANLYHVASELGVTPENQRIYKVAWVGGCVLYDRAKLQECGGFSFWPELPLDSAGEDVLAQLKVMERYGGCAVLPSGAFHQELPTTLPRREVDAPRVLLPRARQAASGQLASSIGRSADGSGKRA